MGALGPMQRRPKGKLGSLAGNNSQPFGRKNRLNGNYQYPAAMRFLVKWLRKVRHHRLGSLVVAHQEPDGNALQGWRRIKGRDVAPTAIRLAAVYPGNFNQWPVHADAIRPRGVGAQ